MSGHWPDSSNGYDEKELFLRDDTCMYVYYTLKRVTLEKDGNKRKEAEIVAYNSLFQILMLQNCSRFKGQKVSALKKV